MQTSAASCCFTHRGIFIFWPPRPKEWYLWSRLGSKYGAVIFEDGAPLPAVLAQKPRLAAVVVHIAGCLERTARSCLHF